MRNHPPFLSALEAWDERQELTPMIDFLKDQTAKTWETQIERADRKRHEQER